MTAGGGSRGQGAGSGVLYLVATPIGNLEDITLRALRVLKEADLIACEDTRLTQKLLNHYAIPTRTVSYHAHNEQERAAQLGAELRAGKKIALVSDAGMPAISDPGFRLVSLAIENGVAVVPLPGPAALVAALAASGLPTESFRFGGFLPAKGGQRRDAIREIANSPHTEVFYEAPHRLKDTMQDVVGILGASRPVVVAREITKIHEEFLRGSAAEVFQSLNARGEIKGEITLLIGRGQAAKPEVPAGFTAQQRLEEIMAAEKLDQKSALKKLAREMGVSKSEAYRALQRNR